MNIFNLKKIFNKKEPKIKETDMKTNNECNNFAGCHTSFLKEYIVPCSFKQDLPNDFDFNKETIFIIDDNPGVSSLLEDDLEWFDEEGYIKLTDYNIISYTTTDAGFNYIATQEYYGDRLNIKYAIIDITLIGSKMTEKGNIILDGVDVLNVLEEYNRLSSYVFFTGNNLNPYIKTNKEKIEKFQHLFGKDIFDNIIYKTEHQVLERRKALLSKIFNINI